MTGLECLLVVVNAVAQIEPHPLPEVAPAQFVDQFPAIVPLADPLKHRLLYLRQSQHAMADVRREAGDGTVQMVATFGVASRLHPRQLGFRGLAATGDRTERSLCAGKFLNQQSLEGVS